MTRPSLAEVEAAAHALYAQGRLHHWFPTALPPRYDDMDPIGKSEFEAVVEHVLMAAAAAKAPAGPRAGDPTNNVFELWRLNGEQLPFRVVKETWSRSVAQFYQVEKVEIRNWPYGTAWGRYVREDEVGSLTKIPNAGNFSWRMYRTPKV